MLKPCQRHKTKSTGDLACELVNLRARKLKAQQRLDMLRKHCVGVVADDDFNRMHNEAIGHVAKYG